MSASEVRRPLLRRAAAVPGALLACVLAFVFVRGGAHVFPLDDAYIHLSYARTLAQDGTLGLQPGEPSVGTSSPLWVGALAALSWFVADPFWSVHALTLVAVVGYIALGVRFVDTAFGAEAGDSPARAVFLALVGLLLAANGCLAWMSVSAMETAWVLFLGALAVSIYERRGPGVRLFFLLGLCLLARSTTLALVLAIVVAEMLGRRRWRQLLTSSSVMLLVVAPYALFTRRLTGSLFPNTAKGKLLTYVRGGFDPEGSLHYLGRLCEFHKYVPAAGALVLFLLGWAIVFVVRRRRAARPIQSSQAMPVLALWAVLHVAQYMLAFRTLGQQGRYIAEWNFCVVVVGMSVLGQVLVGRRRLARAAMIGGGLLVAQLASLPLWARIYARDVRHVDSEYVRMAEFVRSHTDAGARVASFDIGALRYISGRYTIDLGGLVDTSTHACLAARTCAPYVRARGATHIVYPKDPDSDGLTGVQRALHHGDYLLRERFITQFIAPDEDVPTLTHSFRLQLFEIEGWFARADVEQVLAAFEPERPAADLSSASDEELEIVDHRTDVSRTTPIRGYPQTMTLWLSYRARRALTHAKWLHLRFAEQGREAETSLDVPVLGGALPPEAWPVGRVLGEHLVVKVPFKGHSRRLVISASISDAPNVAEREARWLEVGTVEVVPSSIRALAPL
jgi:hypothetical protein